MLRMNRTLVDAAPCAGHCVGAPPSPGVIHPLPRRPLVPSPLLYSPFVSVPVLSLLPKLPATLPCVSSCAHYWLLYSYWILLLFHIRHRDKRARPSPIDESSSLVSHINTLTVHLIALLCFQINRPASGPSYVHGITCRGRGELRLMLPV